MEGSAVSPHRRGVERLRRGQKLKGRRRGCRKKRGRRRRSVDPAFTVSGCHLFTHSIVCIGPATTSEVCPTLSPRNDIKIVIYSM